MIFYRTAENDRQDQGRCRSEPQFVSNVKMSPVTTPAIMLRRIPYGDFDLIVTFFSLTHGKISLMAKSAKTSKKRFGGILEPFSALQVVYQTGRSRGLAVLQEASLIEPFSNIRQNIGKTAYASYMAELVYDWTEEHHQQEALYHLLLYTLGELNEAGVSADALSLLFQMRFLGLSGFQPGLNACVSCKTPADQLEETRLMIDLKKGGLVCGRCRRVSETEFTLSKGTIKQLLWIARGDLKNAARVKLSPLALKEGLQFLEAFVPFHMGKEPRSLKFLQQLRR